MKWKRWKVGLVVAALTGGLTGLAMFAVLDQFTWTVLVKMLLVTLGIMAKDALLFLKDHPAEDALADDSAPKT